MSAYFGYLRGWVMSPEKWYVLLSAKVLDMFIT